MKKEHRSDLVYKYECDISIGCDPWDNYVGETGFRIGTRDEQHAAETEKN